MRMDEDVERTKERLGTRSLLSVSLHMTKGQRSNGKPVTAVVNTARKAVSSTLFEALASSAED
jgi:hypothetical protein